jgi:ubiquinone/menaquinone biosynthesis C-methylase UbiE
MPLDDPETVKAQYAREDNLRARQSLYKEVTGPHPHDVLWQTLVEWSPRRVLEVGGGPGELSERMLKELGAEVSFLDISPRMVELARERGVVDAQVGDVQSLPFEDGTFDTVVAAWMLYHVPDIDRGLAEIARVLRPGGVAAIHHADGRNRGVAPSRRGWRAPMTAALFAAFARERGLEVERVVRSWGRDRDALGAFGDAISVLRRPA